MTAEGPAPEIVVLPDAAAAATAIAERFVATVGAAVERAGVARVALTGGSTPERAYARLAEPGFRDRVRWDRVQLFWGDERCVPPGHPRSNWGMAERALLRHVPIPAENVHRMRGELPPERAAREYAERLAEAFDGGPPRWDLLHLGLGENTHVASLSPFADTLRERERLVTVALLPELGEWRVTLTFPALNAAREVHFLVTGRGKAAAVHSVLRGPLDPFRVPAQGIRPHDGRVVWLLDRAAAAALPSELPKLELPFPLKQSTLSENDVLRIVHGEHPDPFSVLGPHRAANGARVIRAFFPGAVACEVVSASGGAATPMVRLHPAGFWEAETEDGGAYRLRARWPDGGEWETEDPYAFGSALGELDLHLLGEGQHRRLYRVLGAHPVEVNGVRGVRFAVWAPNARRVGVVGDWNGWDGRRNPMRRHPGIGVWDLFIPRLEPGALYKYEILPRDGDAFLKSDPVGFGAELRPATASVVRGLGDYAWGDGEWMTRRRADADPAAGPMQIYEVHPGSWRRAEDDRPLTYRELAGELGDYVERMGFTHVELLPIMEHPYDPSWGYQVTGYFAPTSRFGTADDFRFLIDSLHRRGIGVLLDWVPAHFPKDAAGLRRFDGTALYEHEDPRQGEHPEWGTLVFNFGRNEVRNFLVANALYWLDEFHIDGLRVDAVASMLYLDYSRQEGEWIPNPHGGRENLEAVGFVRELNGIVRDECPGALMIAEESTAWPGVTRPVEQGGLGFHLKWNMGWMNDFLRFMEEDPVHRKHHLGQLTFSLMYAFSERFVLPLSHDEVVHGKRSLLEKMPGDDWRKFANLRLALGFMWGHPGKKLLFMGGELAQRAEWSEARSLDWHLLEHAPHAGVQHWVADLCALGRREPALWERDDTPEGWEWIDFRDTENSVVSFLRKDADGNPLVFVCNFTPIPRHDYRIGVPVEGRYRELLNSDSAVYGGSDLGNGAAVSAESVPEHGRPHSLRLVVPPLGVLILKPE